MATAEMLVAIRSGILLAAVRRVLLRANLDVRAFPALAQNRDCQDHAKGRCVVYSGAGQATQTTAHAQASSHSHLPFRHHHRNHQRFGCEFADFFGHPDGATPPELLKRNLYSEIAVVADATLGPRRLLYITKYAE